MTAAEWIPTSAAARRLNVSERTVLRMAHNGKLRAQRWGSGLVRPQLRIDPASVDAILTPSTTPTATTTPNSN